MPPNRTHILEPSPLSNTIGTAVVHCIWNGQMLACGISPVVSQQRGRHVPNLPHPTRVTLLPLSAVLEFQLIRARDLKHARCTYSVGCPYSLPVMKLIVQ